MKGLFLLLISLFLFPTCVTAQKWKTEVTRLMALGKYAEAEAICSKELAKHKNPKGKQVSEVIHLKTTLGNIYCKWEKFSTSEKMLNQALNNAKQLLSPKDSVYVIALMNMGDFYSQRGKFTKADSLYDAALRLMGGIWKEKNKYYFECLNAKGMIACYKGYYITAINLYDKALETWKISNADSSIYHTLLIYYAQVKYLQGNTALAFQYSKESMLYWKKFKDIAPIIYAEYLALASSVSVNNIGIEEAIKLLQKSEALFQQYLGNTSGKRMIVLQGLGEVSRGLEDKKMSFTYLHRADSILQLKPEGYGFEDANISNSLSALYHSTNNFKQAISYAEKSVVMYRKFVIEPSYFELYILNSLLTANMGEADMNLSYRKASKKIRDSLSFEIKQLYDNLFVNQIPPIYCITMLQNMAMHYIFEHNYLQGEKTLLTTLTIATKIDSMKLGEVDWIALYLNIGEFYIAYPSCRDITKATHYLTLGNNILQKEEEYRIPLQINYLKYLALVADFTNNNALANSLYKDYLLLNYKYLTNLSSFTNASNQQQYLHAGDESVMYIYHSFCSKAKDISPSILQDEYNQLLTQKAYLLFNQQQIKRLILSSPDKEVPNLYNNLVQLQATLGQCANYTDSFLIKNGINIKALQMQAEALEIEINRRVAGFSEALKINTTTWSQIQEALKLNEAAVEIVKFRYYDTTFTNQFYYAALILTSETTTQPEYVLLKNGNELDSLYDTYLKGVNNPNNVKDLKKCYRKYWHQIAEKLKGKTKIYLSADGIYHKLNIGALMNEANEYVLNTCEIVPLASTRSIVKPYSSEITHPNTILLVAEPLFLGLPNELKLDSIAFRGGYEPLPNTGIEARSIKEMYDAAGWNTILYTGQKATEEKIKNTEGIEILHIATHGFYDSTQANKNPIVSNILSAMQHAGLRLTGALTTHLKAGTEETITGDDGNLLASEIENMNLQGTRLVVLSACYTGSGLIENAEGVFGLQRAFFMAGAKNVVISLDKVGDEDTKELMLLFYQNLLQSNNSQTALYQTQLKLMKQYPTEPHKWCRFVHIGQ